MPNKWSFIVQYSSYFNTEDKKMIINLIKSANLPNNTVFINGGKNEIGVILDLVYDDLIEQIYQIVKLNKDTLSQQF